MNYKYFVYILKCSDESLYTGITNNLEKRFKEHQNGLKRSSYTYRRRPLKLIFQAIYFEKKLKGWTRAKKQSLIDGNGELLQILSECSNASHYKYKVDDNL